MSTGLFLVRRRQHLHDALDLLLAPDDRVELLLARELGEVAAELVEHERAATGLASARRRRPAGATFLRAGVARQQLDDLLAHAGQVGAELHEHLRGDAFALADEPEEDVLGADVVVAELQRLAQRELEDLLGAGRERDVARRREPPWPMISSTWARTASSEMPSDSSALAATPSPSWIRPSRMCSVPM